MVFVIVIIREQKKENIKFIYIFHYKFSILSFKINSDSVFFSPFFTLLFFKIFSLKNFKECLFLYQMKKIY